MSPDLQKPSGRAGVLVLITNDAWFLVSHRLAIAASAVASGWSVHVVARRDHTVPRIEAVGCTFHDWELSPRGRSLHQEWRAYAELKDILTRLRPDVVHLVTIKAVLYGGLACRRLQVPSVVYAIAGLGSVFVGTGLRAALLRRAVLPLYGRAIGHPHAAFIFQNPDDRAAFEACFESAERRTLLVPGSGVDLERCVAVPEPPAPPVVITLAARLLRDKGIVEFVEAAGLLRSRGLDIDCRVVGGAAGQGNPASLDADVLARLASDGAVRFCGPSEDVPGCYAASHIVCLPSWREGMPKALLEAAACGRAVVTTDVPGCRDAIDPGVTGLLVPARRADALADALERLVRDPTLRGSMGRRGRELAECRFDVGAVVRTHLALYGELLVERRGDPGNPAAPEAADP